MSNPWALSAGEIRTLELLIELGSQKAVARRLDRSLKTVESTLAKVRLKMGACTVKCAALWSGRARAEPSEPA